MRWYDKQDGVNMKVQSVVFDVESRDGQLWGVAECKVLAELLPEEKEAFAEYISGQASDGWGEGFEQRAIKLDEGELYVSLWNSSSWSIQTEEEKFSPDSLTRLPDLCRSVLSSDGSLICIKRGESGYLLSDWNTRDPDMNRRLADSINQRRGNTNYAKDSQGKRKRLLLYIALGAIFLAACIIAGLFLFPTEEPEEAGSGGIIYDLDAVTGGWESLSEEEITEALNNKVAEGMINISMNTAPVFADGQAKGNLMIVNELVNTYPQRVELYRNDTEELIYISDAIPVGSKIAEAALDVDLEAGVYECTAMFHSLDPDTGAVLGTAGAVVTLTVQA